jgi:hypothetical protein
MDSECSSFQGCATGCSIKACTRVFTGGGCCTGYLTSDGRFFPCDSTVCSGNASGCNSAAADVVKSCLCK